MKNKHAILIMAYKPKEVEYLLKQLDYELFDIYIHIDKKINFNIKQLYNCVKKSKIYIYSKYKIYWADFSQTKCQIFLLEEAFNKHLYSYYHLLSESDFPLKSNENLYNYFEKKGKNFIHFESRELSNEKKKFIDRYYLFQKYNRHSKIFTFLEEINLKIQKIIGINRLNSNLKYCCGANWFSIKNDVAWLVLKNKKNIYKMFSNTRSSDEFVLQTLIINSNLIDTLYYKEFDNDYCACQRYIDWTRGKPYVFKEDDINELLNCNYCFVRKVNLDDNLRKKISIKIGDKNE